MTHKIYIVVRHISDYRYFSYFVPQNVKNLRSENEKKIVDVIQFRNLKDSFLFLRININCQKQIDLNELFTVKCIVRIFLYGRHINVENCHNF